MHNHSKRSSLLHGLYLLAFKLTKLLYEYVFEEWCSWLAWTTFDAVLHLVVTQLSARWASLAPLFIQFGWL